MAAHWGSMSQYSVTDPRTTPAAGSSLRSRYWISSSSCSTATTTGRCASPGMWERFAASDARAMVTVYRNQDDYTRNGVCLGPDGTVLMYDKSRTHPDLRGVEIGYAIVDRSVVEGCHRTTLASRPRSTRPWPRNGACWRSRPTTATTASGHSITSP